MRATGKELGSVYRALRSLKTQGVDDIVSGLAGESDDIDSLANRYAKSGEREWEGLHVALPSWILVRASGSVDLETTSIEEQFFRSSGLVCPYWVLGRSAKNAPFVRLPARPLIPVSDRKLGHAFEGMLEHLETQPKNELGKAALVWRLGVLVEGLSPEIPHLPPKEHKRENSLDRRLQRLAGRLKNVAFAGAFEQGIWGQWADCFVGIRNALSHFDDDDLRRGRHPFNQTDLQFVRAAEYCVSSYREVEEAATAITLAVFQRNRVELESRPMTSKMFDQILCETVEYDYGVTA